MLGAIIGDIAGSRFEWNNIYANGHEQKLILNQHL